MKKNQCLLMALLMLLSVSPMRVCAAEPALVGANKVESLEMITVDKELMDENNSANAKAMLHNCLISVYSSSNGMEVAFMTSCSQTASIVGIKDVVIKQKVWYGWKTVATSSGGYRTNDTTYMGTILYTNAIKDETYRITCVHYADADEYREVEGELDVVFTY